MILRLRHGDCVEVLADYSEGSVGGVVSDPPYEISFMDRGWDATGVAYDPRLWGHLYRVLVPGGMVKAFSATRTFHRMAAAMQAAGFTDLNVEAWNYGSGFPKSHSVGKGIDKRPGVQGHTNFAVHLRARRLAKGLSTSDVAEKIVGSRSGACRNWERYQFPEARWWPALRDLLGLDPQWGDILAEAKRDVVGVNPNVLRAHKSQGGQVTFGGAGGAEVTTPSTEAAKRWDGWGTALKPAWEPVIVGRKPE